MVEGEVVGAARKGVETVRPAAVERLAERLVRATVVGKELRGGEQQCSVSLVRSLLEIADC